MISITYVKACHGCGDVATEHYNLHDEALAGGEALPRPSVPPGWHLVDGALYCPAHRITISTGA